MFHSPVNAWTNNELMNYAAEYVQAIENAVWAEDGRPVFQQLAEENGTIDAYDDYLYESAVANEKLWFNGRAFTEDVEEYLKPWFRERLAWMDVQFASVETLMRSLNPDDTAR